MYLFVDNVSLRSYEVNVSLDKLKEEDLDLVVKKDSTFITNTISCILDDKGDIDG